MGVDAPQSEGRQSHKMLIRTAQIPKVYKRKVQTTLNTKKTLKQKQKQTKSPGNYTEEEMNVPNTFINEKKTNLSQNTIFFNAYLGKKKSENAKDWSDYGFTESPLNYM